MIRSTETTETAPRRGKYPRADPSYDGRLPNEWIDGYVWQVYGQFGHRPPADFYSGRIRSKLHALRKHYSLEEVLACRAYLLRENAHYREGYLPIEAILDEIGPYVKRVGRRAQDRRQQQHPEHH